MNKACVGRGFTIIEILMVVAVIAILGMVAMIGYQQYQQRARAADIVVAYDAIRSGVGAEIAQGGVNECAELVKRLGNTNLKDPYARLAYGFEAVAGGYRPVLTVCAKADTHGTLGVQVARGAHDTIAQTGRVEKGAVLTDSLVSFAAPLTDTGRAACTVAPPSVTTACGDPAPAAAAATRPGQPTSQADCQPHQHFVAGMGCNNVCNPGWYYVEDPTPRCSSTPASSQVTAGPTGQPPLTAVQPGTTNQPPAMTGQTGPTGQPPVTAGQQGSTAQPPAATGQAGSSSQHPPHPSSAGGGTRPPPEGHKGKGH